MKVSICMATFNGENYLHEQIASILPQLSPNDEFIISDDGSQDATLGIIASFRDSRIRVLSFDGKNILRNFENALKYAKGDYIFLADQDDIWFPDKVRVCLSYLHQYDLVFTNLKVFNEDLADSILMYSKGKRRTGIIRNVIKNNYVGATMCFRRSVLDKALPFPGNVYMHDIWLAMVAEVIGHTYFIEEPLIYYRRHEHNASETGQKSSNTILRKIRMRICLLYYLIKRFI